MDPATMVVSATIDAGILYQAAAALVCWQVEKTVLVGAATVGATIIWTTRAVWLWLVLAALCAAATLVAGRQARYGWVYLQAAHSTGRPTPSDVVSAIPETTQQTTAVPVPTAGQVLVRTLPEAAVVIVGLPLVVRFVLDENGEARMVWWPVPLLALFGLALLVHRYAQAPRPRFDQRVGEAQWKPAFAAVAKTGSLPEHPEVRDAVGVLACQIVEGLVVGIAMVAALALSALAAPGFPWVAALGVSMVFTGIDAVRGSPGLGLPARPAHRRPHRLTTRRAELHQAYSSGTSAGSTTSSATSSCTR